MSTRRLQNVDWVAEMGKLHEPVSLPHSQAQMPADEFDLADSFDLSGS